MRPAIKKDHAEIARRVAQREANTRAAKWIFALAWCGLSVREIATVLAIDDLSLVRQPLYANGWLLNDKVQRPARVPDKIRELWADETNMPHGLKEALAKQDARQAK